MRAATLSIAGIALLGTGFGVGWLMAAGEPRTIVIDRTAPGGSPTRPEEVVYFNGTAPSAPPSATPRTATGGGRAVASVDELLAAIGPPAVPSGSGIIEVAVHTADGTPVPDIEVTLLPQAPDRGAAKRWGDPEADPAELLEFAARQLVWTREARRTARTGPTGQCTFPGLADGSHSVTARSDDWQVRPSDYRSAREAHAGDTVDFVASPVVRVPLRVLNADGTPANDSTVMFKRGNARSGQNWSEARPDLPVEPGRYEIWAQASGDDAADRSESRTVEVERGVTPPTLVLHLVERPSLVGRVIPPNDFRLQQVIVYLLPLPPGTEPDASLLVSQGRNAWAHARQGFRYSFTDVTPGDHVVGIAPGWNQPVDGMQVVRIEDGRTERDLGLPPPAREKYLVADVRGPDGAPVDDLQFMLSFEAGRSSRSTGAQGFRHADGSWWLPHQAVDAAIDGEAKWTLKVTSPEFGSREVEYRPTSATAVSVRFEAAAEAVVTVTGLKGSGWEGRVDVQIVPWEDGPAWRRRMQTYRNDPRTRLDEDGRRTLTGLQPGAHRLLLLAGGVRLRTVAETKVMLSPGTTAVSIALPPLHRVTVGGGVGNVNIQQRFQNEGMTRTIGVASLAVVDGGTVTFDGLTEGTYQANTSGKKAVDFTVPGTTRVDFE